MTKMVQKTTGYERIVHWMMAVSCIVLLLTGFGFLYQQELGWLNTIFGGQHLARLFHNWGGVIFTISVILSLPIWLPEASKFTKEDNEWLGMLGGYLSKDKDKKVPPQGKLNAGQMLVVWVVEFFGILIIISGFLLWLVDGSKTMIMWGHFLHNVSFFVFALFVPVHIYLGSVANPGTFRIMTRGDIPLYWAKKKHPSWVKEIGAE